MTREEVIEEMQNMVYDVNLEEITAHDSNTSLRHWTLAWGNKMLQLIKALEQEPCEDCISRQAAIDALKEKVFHNLTDEFYGAMQVLDELPSVEPKIISCKDCKWWDKSEDSPFGYCMAMKHGYMSANWEIGIYRRYKGDFYCADAEREDNE